MLPATLERNAVGKFNETSFFLMAGRLVEEIGLKAMEHCSVLMPVILTLLRDDHYIVAKQSIVSGSNFFSSILQEMSLQVSFSLVVLQTFSLLNFMHTLWIRLKEIVFLPNLFSCRVNEFAIHLQSA